MEMTTNQKLTMFKEHVKANQLIARKFNLHEILIIDKETISIKGSFLFLEHKAFKDLISILGMTEKTMKVFDQNFGEDRTQAVLELIQRGLSSSGATVVIYANPKTKCVDRITPGEKVVKGLSINSYFNALDRLMNENPNFEIKRMISDSDLVQIDLKDPKAEFKVGGKNLETFHPGISFGTSFNQPTFLNNFTERLVCTNGMVHRDTQTAYSLNENFTKEQWVKFFDHFEEIKKSGYISTVFNEKVETAMNTNASLLEMKTMSSLLANYANNDSDLWIPYKETKEKFFDIGVNTNVLTDVQLATAKTGVKVWDLINAVTDFASHDYKYNISSRSNLNMQVAAGKLLMKQSYDMQNIVTQSPY